MLRRKTDYNFNQCHGNYSIRFLMFFGTTEMECCHQIDKIVKHTQKIHQLLPANYLRVFDHFVELSLKGLRDSQGDYGRFKLKQRVLLIYYQGF